VPRLPQIEQLRLVCEGITDTAAGQGCRRDLVMLCFVEFIFEAFSSRGHKRTCCHLSLLHECRTSPSADSRAPHLRKALAISATLAEVGESVSCPFLVRDLVDIVSSSFVVFTNGGQCFSKFVCRRRIDAMPEFLLDLDAEFRPANYPAGLCKNIYRISIENSQKSAQKQWKKVPKT
jgi:hypothetical protein